jgi:hypothetical protein
MHLRMNAWKDGKPERASEGSNGVIIVEVTATIAFLEGDREGLLAAREQIASGPEWEGAIPNLNVVDRLIANFGKPYSEAY